MARSSHSVVVSYLPIVGWLPAYRRSRVHGDAVGALTAWAIVVAESVAYAQIAGVPPQNAFFAAPVALVVYAVFGSSRNLVVGATSAAAILSASTVAQVSANTSDAIELSAGLAIMAGVILIVARLLRLGFVTNFLAEPVLTGFLFGMALIIVVRQAGKIVGISSGAGDFFTRLWHVLADMGDWSVATIAYSSAPAVVELGRSRDGEYVEVGDRTDLHRVPGVLLLRPDGALFFGNADHVRHAVLTRVNAADACPEVVGLVLTASYRLGLPVLDTLVELRQNLHQLGVDLWLAGVTTRALPQLRRHTLADDLRPDRIWHSVTGAIAHYQR